MKKFCLREKKCFKFVMLIAFLTANICMVIGHSYEFSDFASGFIDGVEGVCVGVWLPYLGFCLVRHENPFDMKNKGE